VAQILRVRAGIMATERSYAAWNTAASRFGSTDVRDYERARQSIGRTYQRLAAAWTRGDADAIGAVLANDCDHLMFGGKNPMKRGRAELLQSWAAAFARRGPDFSIRLTPAVHGVRLLSWDLALVDGDFNYSGGIGTDGTPHEKSTQPFTAVMTRHASGQEWTVLSIRAGAANRPVRIASAS
jgi:ketosteroid isomerase-like protein